MIDRIRKKGGPYRSRRGVVFGVCRGFAEYMDVSVAWMRIILVVIGFLTAWVPTILGYVIVALLMKPAPVVPINTDAEQEFYNSYTSSRHMALQRLKRTFDRLDRRIRRMEGIVTDREYDWQRRFGQ